LLPRELTLLALLEPLLAELPLLLEALLALGELALLELLLA